MPTLERLEPAERVPATPLLVWNMAGKTTCPSGHMYHQALYEGKPGSDSYIGVCKLDPDCQTYFYPISKKDEVVINWLESVLRVCESCQKGEHTCNGRHWTRCNCPCRDSSFRHKEISVDQAAARILLEKYGIEMTVIPELPIPDEELRASHELCIFQIEVDRMRIRSMKLTEENRPRSPDY